MIRPMIVALAASLLCVTPSLAHGPDTTARALALSAKAQASSAQDAADAAQADADDALAFEGVIGTLSSGYSGADFTTGVVIAFDTKTVVGEDAGFTLSSGVFTVPAGVSIIEVSSQLTLGSLTANLLTTLDVQKNGADLSPFVKQKKTTANGGPTMDVASYPISVTAGDTISVLLTVQTDTSSDVFSTGSWVAIKVLQ